MDRIILDSTVVWVGTETDTYYSSQFQLLSRIFVNWDNSLYSWTLAFTTHVWSGRVLFCFFPCLFLWVTWRCWQVAQLNRCWRPMHCIAWKSQTPMSWRSFHGCPVLLYAHRKCWISTTISMVGWSLTSLFSTNTAILKMNGQGWRVVIIPSKGRLAIY